MNEIVSQSARAIVYRPVYRFFIFLMNHHTHFHFNYITCDEKFTVAKTKLITMSQTCTSRYH
ncbi:hypothetical protein DERF_000317 [Dermatophagoides farinae]|uniref:Uncharacterized protein n=1 Tax=Dermatophagoides farinae TaxID=6954 RepID=A0A922I8F2_DERFA|nr:hypothetical protein DERF_000317 [Dermatophagoides farinae]